MRIVSFFPNPLPTPLAEGLSGIAEVVFWTKLTEEQKQSLQDVQIVVTSPTVKMDKALFDLLPNLKMAASLGVGFDKVDLEEVKRRQGNGKAPVCIATVTGTEEDVQVRSRQIEKLRQAGIVVADNTRQAVTAAARIVRSRKNAAAHLPESSLLKDKPKVVNIGLRSFAQNLQDCNVSCVQYEWVPACQGNERLQKLLSRMK